MGRYLLSPEYRLRGWKGDPFYLEHFPTRMLKKLNLSEFSFFLRCDGKTEIDPEVWPPVPEWALAEGVIAPCAEGAVLKSEQEYLLYPNRKLDYIELSLTGRCNLNCRHCFNAKDCNPRSAEPSMEQLFALLDDMDACGVGRMRLNGGEPLVRRDLLTFTAEMGRRGIRLYELLTNGTLLTEDFLDSLEAQGHRPIWFISFDGLGYHDWLRGVKGTEKKAIEAIELLCRRGHTVCVHQCVWKDSLPSVQPTVLKLQELGVARYRILPVEPSLRWQALAPDQSIGTEEWLTYMLSFLEWWQESDIRMDLDIWSFWMHKYGDRKAFIVPDLASGGRSDAGYACETHRGRPFIDADGRVVPCMPLSGITDAYGIGWGNVYQGDDLKELFTDSPFLDQISCTCGQIKENNEKCRNCSWRNRCAAGCRAEALARSHCIEGIDDRICTFFEKGFYERLLALAGKWGLKI